MTLMFDAYLLDLLFDSEGGGSIPPELLQDSFIFLTIAMSI
jgi:hypothetical protein